MNEARRRSLPGVLAATLALVVSAGCSDDDVTSPPTNLRCEDLILSEYVEGSGNNKGLELFNGTGSPIDLAAGIYVYQDYHNGNTNPTHTLALSGVVPAGGTFTLCNSAWALAAACNQQDVGVDFNGNDTVVLRRAGAGGPVVDSLGRRGEDPGFQWGTNPNTLDSTLRRKPTVTGGDEIEDDAFDPALEWDGSPQNDVTGFGSHANLCP